ncbi:MAG: Gfo/Idh/MocA family oxidoreductase [Erysipelotrichaceae bacterium]|nr:Gfo/Idh/MocA family oxidoreductase [Erysipelotrichaceae bacterium]
MNIGIIGAGHIAIKMANTINSLKDFTCYAIASRSLNKAIDFKEKYHFIKAYGSYEELLKDDNVDFVYIATPHSLHYEQMKLCLEYKKNVLCEKILTTSYKDTKEIYSLFEKENLLLLEALWTSFMPSRKVINDLINSKIIGDLTSVFAFFETNLMHKERVVKKELGGGALFDIGLYPITFIFRTLGFNYDYFNVDNIEYENEVDVKETITFYHKDIKAKAIVDAKINGRRDVVIKGNNGTIYIDNVTNPSIITIKDISDNIIKQLDLTPKYGGFEYELLSFKEAMDNKEFDHKLWSHQDSMKLSIVLDEILSNRQ